MANYILVAGGGLDHKLDKGKIKKKEVQALKKIQTKTNKQKRKIIVDAGHK